MLLLGLTILAPPPPPSSPPPPPPPPPLFPTAAESGNGENEATKTSDMFAMIGTLFLWMFWPSFNGAMATESQQHRVVINTLLSLCACCVSAFLFSTLLRGLSKQLEVNSHGISWSNDTSHYKFDMVDIQNATLAGGVAVGSSADLVIEPWGAIVVGIVAGFVSVAGYVFIQPFLQRAIGLHDTCGVHNLHGMPGILGGIAGMISAMTAGEEKYGQSISTVFPKRANGRRYERARCTLRTFYLYTNSQSNCLE